MRSPVSAFWFPEFLKPGMVRHATLSAALLILSAALPVQQLAASPWAEVGDVRLRSDLQLLAAAGVVDQITTHWPVPWAGVMDSLNRPGALDGQSAAIMAAAQRVLAKAESQLEPDRIRGSAGLDISSAPAVVYGFDGGVRNYVAAGQLSGELISGDTAIRISAGALLSKFSGGQGKFMPDGSYLAERIGGAVVYAGYLTHWWGPGWISALSLSNNARPFPQIGVERLTTEPFHSPWLSWLGPWQAEFIVGLFDDKRVATNTLWDGWRITLNPLHGLEIGLSLSEESCGKGPTESLHPCKPLATYFDLRNAASHPTRVNGEGLADIKYSDFAWGIPWELYAQVMNEDSPPFTYSQTSHLLGGSIWIPHGNNDIRLTVEYTNTIATLNLYDFNSNYIYGSTYNDYKYPFDGMRYDKRDLGFSLDSDSRLLSVQTSFVDSSGRSYTLTAHRAWVATPFTELGFQGAANPLTTASVTIDILEGRVSFPFRGVKVDLSARVQDDQFRPNRGFTAALETALRWDFE
jgi:capsule assembly protein Wzi